MLRYIASQIRNLRRRNVQGWPILNESIQSAHIEANDIRIWAITMVKNEGDIIESFIRKNLSIVDRIVVIDNESEDKTKIILNKLMEEGLPIDLKSEPNICHDQSTVISRELHLAFSNSTVTHVVLLDGDEILVEGASGSFRSELAILQRGVCGKIPWVTYVPTPDDDWEEADPVRRITHRRESEPVVFYKVIVPRSAVTPGLWISNGNHEVMLPGGKPAPMCILADTTIAHFPVRSEAQLFGKVILGEWALRLKPTRGEREGHHWTDLCSRVIADGPLTKTDIMEIACNYAASRHKGRSVATPLVHEPVVSDERTIVQYTGLAHSDPHQRILKWTDHLLATNGWQSVRGQYLLRTPKIAVKQGRHGYFCFAQADTVIGRSLSMYGEWGEGEIELLRRMVRKGDVVLDVGANIGTHAVPMAEAVGEKGVVYAFEPQRHVYHLLCANVALNGIENVIAYRTAVGAEPGTITVPIRPINECRNIGNTNIENTDQGEPVPLATIDQLDLQRCDLIKVDVEGMEKAVLLGASSTIKKSDPIIYVENNIEENSTEVIGCLQELGYKCWWHLEDYFNDDNFYEERHNIFSDVARLEINLLCMAKGSPPKLDSLIEVTDVSDTWQAALARRGEQGVGASPSAHTATPDRPIT